MLGEIYKDGLQCVCGEIRSSLSKSSLYPQNYSRSPVHYTAAVQRHEIDLTTPTGTNRGKEDLREKTQSRGRKH